MIEMLRLKATKSSLYKLVSEFAPLPIMKYVDFFKAPRQPSYSLDWTINDEDYHVYFTACLGAPILAITTPAGRTVYKLTVEDLQVCGVIEQAGR